MNPTVQDDAAVRIGRVLEEAAAVHAGLAATAQASILAASQAMLTSLRSGGRVLAFGNGGSAAEAEHFAADLVGRFQRDRRALAAVALTADTSALTAIANDYGFERVFARQIEALGRAGDVALAISTSGTSANVVEGLRAARRLGLVSIALTGRDGGALGREADVHVNVPHPITARVQEAQLTILHVFCELVEVGIVDEGGGT